MNPNNGSARCHRPRAMDCAGLIPAILALLAIATPGMAAGAGSVSGDNPASFDILLRGGRVIDGAGNPWFRAEVGIRD